MSEIRLSRLPDRQQVYFPVEGVTSRQINLRWYDRTISLGHTFKKLMACLLENRFQPARVNLEILADGIERQARRPARRLVDVRPGFGAPTSQFEVGLARLSAHL